MKFSILLSISFSLLFLSACNKEGCDNIQLTIINSLDHDLEAMTMENLDFGVLESGETKVLCMDQANLIGETIIDLIVEGKYNGTQVTSSFMQCNPNPEIMICGLVSSATITEGNFELELVGVDSCFLNIKYN